MEVNKSLDPLRIIVTLLSDAQTSHSEVLSPRALRLTTQKVEKRYAREGVGFLTKTLPRLGKALDRALSGEVMLDASKYAFSSMPNSKLPRFLGELFQLIFSHDGRVLPRPCVRSIRTLRQILYSFYKYKLPYSTDQEQDVLQKFVKTEQDVRVYHDLFSEIAELIECNPKGYDRIFPINSRRIIRIARQRLSSLFSNFDHRDIRPRHGPGAVSTRERLWGKYTWSTISPRIMESYPFDEYFCSSLGHVCDTYKDLASLKFEESSARVLLVPKDSRGPRLISCEPLDFQWIQQGLGRALVEHIERHPLTRDSVRFTDQEPNRFGALMGSLTGRYSTLDLNEASDRVTVGLVRLLFPEPLLGALMNCRSQSTVLPDGSVLKLNKFAPMGSALCFPILALTVWAILTAGSPDADTRKSIYVYGDDVIVPTAHAASAIEQLESFGLKINRDKSCTSGFFRESCGMDAYKGEPVTPVRFRTVWSSSRCPSVYVSYIAYANELYKRHYYATYDLIAGELFRIYGQIPEVSMNLSAPSLLVVPEEYRPKRRRVNRSLQKLQYHVYDVKARVIRHNIDGWKQLLRYFSEGCSTAPVMHANDKPRRSGVLSDEVDLSLFRRPFSASSYTKRDTNSLVKRWR